MADGWQRRAWAEVDLDAISSNARVMKAVASPAELCAVVKADGYGHGAVPVATAALAGGASSLAVALVEEGVVKLDSGMHRVGADFEQARRIVEQVVESPELCYAGLWTHLAVADEPDDPFTGEQLARFEALRSSLEAAGLPAPGRLHAANSAGAIAHASSRLDVVRCGISLYGYLPSAAVSPAPIEAAGLGALRPALTWKTQVSHVRILSAGERTSYGRAYVLAERADIATVPVGYADGVPRSLFEGGGELLIGGRRRQVAGTVTMDQLLVDCGPDSGVRCGDEVVLIGSQGDETVSAQEWADRIGTVSYEILCRIGPRLPRRHVHGGGQL